MRFYTYLGDRLTDIKYKGQTCINVINPSTGKCIRGKNGNMLVAFPLSKTKLDYVVVLARLLRLKNKSNTNEH